MEDKTFMPRTTKTMETSSSPLAVSQQIHGHITVFILIVLLFFAVGIAGYFYYKYKHTASPASDTVEVARLTEEIGAVMDLPGGETPTLATVTDQEKLADQPFFQKAQNGDKVLIYTNNGRAILYRPGAKQGDRGKIIDVTTINVNTPSSPSTTSASPEATPSPVTSNTSTEVSKVALYNGSTKIGATQSVEGDITTAFPDGVEVVAKEKAVKSDYKGTLVVDVTSKSPEKASEIAKALGGAVVSMPEGETAPKDTDILVIIGNSGV